MDIAFVIPNTGDGLVIREYKHAGNRDPGSPYTLAEILGLLRGREPGVGLHVIDAQIDSLTPRQVLDKIDSINPEIVVGFLSCFDIPTDRKFIEFSDYTTIGIITPCTVDAREAHRIYNLDIDYFTQTEVEKTILEAVREKLDTGEITETPGLYIPTKGQLVTTGPPEWLDVEPPMPAFELAGFQKYYEVQRQAGADPYLLLNTTKGCPFGCEFCMSSISELTSIKSADQVIAELEQLHEITGATRFRFIDDEFPIRLSRAKDICQGMINFDFNTRFEAMNRVEFLDKELILLADEAGCYLMSFGIETGDEVVQQEINKELDFEHAKAMFERFSETEIQTRAFMTFGLPGESEETINHNKAVLKYLEIDVMSCGTICFPAPCTPLYNRMKAEGRLLVEDWSKYKNPDSLLFEHEYYDSLEEVEKVRDKFRRWWKHYNSRKEFFEHPTPRSAAKMTIDQLKTNSRLYSVVSKYDPLRSVHDNVYSRLERSVS
jgi:radical SAM superfamily enzyme YgiQ (UPF0313 family)